jgi:hypothetical protein
MAGDIEVRLLLEKMTQCASRAYMSILERLVLFSFQFSVHHWLANVYVLFFSQISFPLGCWVCLDVEREGNQRS